MVKTNSVYLVVDCGLGVLAVGCPFYSIGNDSRGQRFTAEPPRLCKVTGNIFDKQDLIVFLFVFADKSFAYYLCVHKWVCVY